MQRINNSKNTAFYDIEYIKINNLEDYNKLEKELYKLNDVDKCQIMIDVENKIIDAENDKEFYSSIMIPIVTIFVSVILSCLITVYFAESDDRIEMLSNYIIVCVASAIILLFLFLRIKAIMKKKMDNIVFFSTIKRMLEYRYSHEKLFTNIKIINQSEHVEERKNIRSSKLKDVWYALIFSISPSYAQKKYGINENMTNGIFVLISSLIMQVIGCVLKLVGIVDFCLSFKNRINGNSDLISYFVSVLLDLTLLIIGSMFSVSSNEIINETDNARIMAYTSVVFALFGIIVTVVMK